MRYQSFHSLQAHHAGPGLHDACDSSWLCLQGVDKAFDDAVDGVAAVQEQLEEHLQDVRRTLKGKSSISYVSLNKDSHVLEVPEVTSSAEGAAGVIIQACMLVPYWYMLQSI